MVRFFPNPAFGWFFLFALAAILIVACYFDLRYLLLPNALTVPALLAGFAINTLRGAWVGLPEDEAWSGAWSGFRFSFFGFLLGFVLFLVLRQLGICKGGDVKLFAAVASWLGWECSYWIWVVSFLILACYVTGWGVIRLLSKKPKRIDPVNPVNVAAQKRGGIMPYALPLTLAVAIVSFWCFRREMGMEL